MSDTGGVVGLLAWAWAEGSPTAAAFSGLGCPWDPVAGAGGPPQPMLTLAKKINATNDTQILIGTPPLIEVVALEPKKLTLFQIEAWSGRNS